MMGTRGNESLIPRFAGLQEATTTADLATLWNCGGMLKDLLHIRADTLRHRDLENYLASSTAHIRLWLA